MKISALVLKVYQFSFHTKIYGQNSVNNVHVGGVKVLCILSDGNLYFCKAS